MKTKSKLERLKNLWNEKYSYISLELDDDQIVYFIVRENGDIQKAANLLADYLLAQGLTEVQE